MGPHRKALMEIHSLQLAKVWLIVHIVFIVKSEILMVFFQFYCCSSRCAFRPVWNATSSSIRGTASIFFFGEEKYWRRTKTIQFVWSSSVILEYCRQIFFHFPNLLQVLRSYVIALAWNGSFTLTNRNCLKNFFLFQNVFLGVLCKIIISWIPGPQCYFWSKLWDLKCQTWLNPPFM